MAAESSVEKLAQSFADLNGNVVNLVAGFASVGSVLRGLQGTREGYQLNYSIQHIFFEIADSLRGPIRAVTREFEGFARVLDATNRMFRTPDALKGTALDNTIYNVGVKIADNINKSTGIGDYIEKTVGDAADWYYGNKTPTITPQTQQQRKADEAKAPAPNERLQPMFSTSFGQVEGLRDMMQKLSTENPAQDKGISLIETIVKLLMKLVGYNDAQIKEAFPDQNPAIKNN